MKIEFVSLGGEVPKRGTVGSAGFDLKAYSEDSICIYPGKVELIRTGIAISIKDPGVVGMLFPRSGAGHSKGLVLGNLTGIIDSDYQGEIKVSAWNRSNKSILILPGDRIAQIVFTYMPTVEFVPVKEFSAETERGSGGFGHTGG